MFKEVRDIIEHDLAAYNAFRDEDTVEDNCYKRALKELDQGEEELKELKAENQQLKKIADGLHFAYVNKDPDFPHQFERGAVEAYIEFERIIEKRR